MRKQDRYKFLVLGVCFSIFSACQQQTDQVINKDFIDEQLHSAVSQYKVLMKTVPDNKFAKSWDPESKLHLCGPEDWVSGFTTGTMLNLYEFSNDKELYEEALEKLDILEVEKNNTGTHDLGFMLYCSFGNAYHLKPTEEHKQILLQGAKSLSTRFNENVGVIRSWGNINDTTDFLVIIDNMMNLEYLMWASKVSDNPLFSEVALSHANTVLRDAFRPDYSSYHLINYDLETGNVREKKTVQGAFDESAWARGQAWGLYGFTMMYRETQDNRFLEQAQNIADFILSHPNLPEDMVPYWDFNADSIPNTYRDASAAAVIASALVELSTFSENTKGEKYQTSAAKILQSLSSPAYKAEPGENGGFLLKHGVGSLPHKSEVDHALTYGDYYYVEALLRYRNLL